MKKIIITAHGNNNPASFVTISGDIYDSSLEVLTEENEILFKTDKVNVDSSVNSKKFIEQLKIWKNYRVEIEDGLYFGKVGMHKNKYKGILLFKYDPNMVDIFKKTPWEIMKEKYWEYRMLPSIFKNPNHDDRKEAWAINIHMGGWNWDWSEGCITVLQDIYWDFMMQSNFQINDLILIEKKSVNKGEK